MAEGDFLESIRLAQSQEALAWELRTATSLARLWRDLGRISEAHELISAVYNRFREGYKTDDLRAANSLLGELSGHR
jgi:predicted ATPase